MLTTIAACSGSSMSWGHGAVDFAGSGVVHATGGWAALALAVILGPRIGKFRKDGKPNAFPGHNLGYVVVGTLVLVFGWMGFNPGSTFAGTDLRIAVVAVNTLLAGCMGTVTAIAWTNYKWGKPDISMACNGMLAGLVVFVLGKKALKGAGEPPEPLSRGTEFVLYGTGLAAVAVMWALVVTVFPFNTHLAFYSTFWGGLTLLLAALYAGSLLSRDAHGPGLSEQG